MRPTLTNVVASALNTFMAPVLTDNDFAQLARFDRSELLRLHTFLTSRLGEPINLETVVTVRLPPNLVAHVKALAFRYHMTRSRIVRQAVDEYTRRNPI